MTVEERIISLISKFPDFKNRVPSYILNDWNAGAFDKWASNTPISDTELIISTFLLMVWNSEHEWKTGKFDIALAVRKLSERSLNVIKDWVQNPFFL